MSKFYLVNDDFSVPLKRESFDDATDDIGLIGSISDDVIELKKGDIIEMRFYNHTGSMIKIAGTDFFYDSHLYLYFMTSNALIFEDITLSYTRGRKLDKIIKKRA